MQEHEAKPSQLPSPSAAQHNIFNLLTSGGNIPTVTSPFSEPVNEAGSTLASKKGFTPRRRKPITEVISQARKRFFIPLEGGPIIEAAT